MSVFGTIAEVKQANACSHAWVGDPGIIWNTIKVEYRCLTCGTYQAIDNRHRSPDTCASG